MTTRDAYIEQMKIQLDEFNNGIKKLEGKTHVAEVQLMNAYQSEMQDLQVQWKKTLLKFDEIKAAGEGSWEKLKLDMEQARNTLSSAIDDFKS